MSTIPSTANQIGLILRNLRKKRNLSQLEVALQCDLSPRHYQELEYGNKNCQIDTLTKILKVHNINLFSFFTSFFIDEFNTNGVKGLYEIFGNEAFGYRAFDLEGNVTYQCPLSVKITGMKDEDVIGKMKIWSDLTDPAMISFIQMSLKYFVNYLPTPPSWKVHIKNHSTNTSHPYMGFLRYTEDSKKKVVGLEIIIFPLDQEA